MDHARLASCRSLILFKVPDTLTVICVNQSLREACFDVLHSQIRGDTQVLYSDLDSSGVSGLAGARGSASFLSSSGPASISPSGRLRRTEVIVTS